MTCNVHDSGENRKPRVVSNIIRDESGRGYPADVLPCLPKTETQMAGYAAEGISFVAWLDRNDFHMT